MTTRKKPQTQTEDNEQKPFSKKEFINSNLLFLRYENLGSSI